MDRPGQGAAPVPAIEVRLAGATTRGSARQIPVFDRYGNIAGREHPKGSRGEKPLRGQMRGSQRLAVREGMRAGGDPLNEGGQGVTLRPSAASPRLRTNIRTKPPARMAGGFVLTGSPNRPTNGPAIRGSPSVLASPAAPSGRLRRSGPLPEDGQRPFGPLGILPFFSP